MRPQTKIAIFNSYLGMHDADPRFKAVDTALESTAGRAVVDALSVALTDGDSRLDHYRSYAAREDEAGQPLVLAAEMILVELVMRAFRDGNEAVLGGEIDG